MAWVEMFVSAPESMDNPKSIRDLDDELTKTLLVCFYLPVPRFMPVQQEDETWPLRIVDISYLEWVKNVLLQQYDFKIASEKLY